MCYTHVDTRTIDTTNMVVFALSGINIYSQQTPMKCEFIGVYCLQATCKEKQV